MNRIQQYRKKFDAMRPIKKAELAIYIALYAVVAGGLLWIVYGLLFETTLDGERFTAAPFIVLYLLFLWFGPEADMGLVWMEVLWMGFFIFVGLAFLAAATTLLLYGSPLAAVCAAAAFGAIAGHVVSLYFSYFYALSRGLVEYGAAVGRLVWSRAIGYLTSKTSALIGAKQ